MVDIPKNTFTFLFINTVFIVCSYAQISPGDLTNAHAKLEGMKNCTQCHSLGAKVSNSKCLACHVEIKERIDLGKGFHSFAQVKGKECVTCHSDHHGRNFQIVRFDLAKFSHETTGFKLEGAHKSKKCDDCHKVSFISETKIKLKSKTYLGLKTECLSCHTDYHQNTLSTSCLNCHGQQSFKPALKFNHASSKFPLLGKHQNVECIKCHQVETRGGRPFQKFTGLQFTNCTSCHTDVHQNKYGQNCKQCHSENSFHEIKNKQNFDHSKTGFKLEGKHSNVNCNSCHKSGYSKELKHDKCADCHSDFHKSQFVQSGQSPDCIKCHTVNGFSPSTFSIEAHKQCEFKLRGAHSAIPCIECHKKQDSWSFRKIGTKCADCHSDIHQALISEKYYPGKSCTNCHIEDKWGEISFDHSQTDFKLTGAHQTTSCRSCHFIKRTNGQEQQKFAGTSINCISCHKDNHDKQFEKNGTTKCNECHVTTSWKVNNFDHSRTAFKLDGKHQQVACIKCHKPVVGETKINYKIKNFKCESCHLQ